MKLSLWCLMHYSNFDALIADKAIAANQHVVEGDMELMAGYRVAVFYKHIGIRFHVITQSDIDAGKSWGKSANDNTDRIEIKGEP
jgi:hypothetical protein